MDDSLSSKKLKADFEDYLDRIFLKNLSLILSIGALVLAYYLISDYSVRGNLWAVATRIPPITLVLILLAIHLVYPDRFLRLKSGMYISIYLSIQLMMYGKCMVHLHDDGLAPSVTGAILVIFLISLDIKQSARITALIYAIPIVLFTLLLWFYGKPSSKEFLVMADIYPIVAIGYVVNRIQYNLRFRLFKSNRLLKLEQEKTKALYKETLQINDELQQKATEAILIKEEIEEKNEELNIMNATKDRFLGIIAHDLKNPIGAIWGLSDVLLGDGSLDEQQKKECIESINKSVKNTHQLLENLLSWAMAQKKAIVCKPSFVDAGEVVENELKVLRPIARKKFIQIHNNIPAGFKMYVDLKMFETIIRNLISNAVKYSYSKGEIHIDARLIHENNRNYTELAVTDNGMGMTDEVQQGLFKISKTISTPGTDHEAGTGLGLLLCKEFVDIQHGFIHVESQLQKGSIFSVCFPNEQ